MGAVLGVYWVQERERVREIDHIFDRDVFPGAEGNDSHNRYHRN